MLHSLIIFHQNIRSLRKNFDQFLAELATFQVCPDIIVLSEIWINSNESNLFNIPDYKLFLKCNDRYRAGGVAVFIKNTSSLVNVSHINLNFQTADVLLISFKYLGHQFRLLSIYRLQMYTEKLFVDEICNYFNNVNNELRNVKNVIWIGDLNINILPDSEFNSSIDNYKSLMAANGFESLVNEPTRITDKSGTCIDHVYARVANKKLLSVQASVIHAGITDHSMLKVCVCVCVCGERWRGGGSGLLLRAGPAIPH